MFRHPRPLRVARSVVLWEEDRRPSAYSMSWEIIPPHKPFYRRTWFLVLLAMAFIAALAGAFVVQRELSRWDAIAATFDYSKLTDMESASIIYDRNKQILGRIFIQNRDEVSLDQLSPHILKAVIAAEDARFYQHDGVDYFGIARAMIRNYQAGRTRQGASTLTQQLARNTFPDELPSNDRSYGRKILEIAVAREIEKKISKQEILEPLFEPGLFRLGFLRRRGRRAGVFWQESDRAESLRGRDAHRAA